MKDKKFIDKVDAMLIEQHRKLNENITGIDAMDYKKVSLRETKVDLRECKVDLRECKTKMKRNHFEKTFMNEKGNEVTMSVRIVDNRITFKKENTINEDETIEIMLTRKEGDNLFDLLECLKYG